MGVLWWLWPIRSQVGASFRNADVAKLSHAALQASEAGAWFIIDSDTSFKTSWTVTISVVLLYTVFWVRGAHRALSRSVLTLPLIASQRSSPFVRKHFGTPALPGALSWAHSWSRPGLFVWCIERSFVAVVMRRQVPFSFAFNQREQQSVFVMDMVCDSIFMADVVLQFCFSYRDHTNK